MAIQPTLTREIFSVTDLNRRARTLLEGNFSQVWVEGEISNFVCPASGHWYFTLKDANSQVRCAMFSNRNRRLQLQPKNGLQVILRGKASLYEGRGEYQLIAENLIESGAGLLQQQFDQLKQKLSEAGLFDPQHKQPLPKLPKHIGVVTSLTGAAIRDILTVLKRRFPAIPVSIIPSSVQGKAAAAEIVRGIKLAHESLQDKNTITPIDVLIVGRGGGSLEDLWPFNEEAVAHAIFNSEIPIVSAVGHEIDFTIADFVADQRAATPSAAAELLSPESSTWQQQLAGYEQYFLDRQISRIAHEQHQLSALQKRLRHPGRQLQEKAQRLDDIEARLKNSIFNTTRSRQSRLSTTNAKLLQHNPMHAIKNMKLSCQQLSQILQELIKKRLYEVEKRLQISAQGLHTLSPLKTLSRGFAVIQNADGQILRSAKYVTTGECVVAHLAEGKLNCKVESIDENDNGLYKS